MAAATSDSSITVELHGALADRLAALGRRRGTRTLVAVALDDAGSVKAVLDRLVNTDDRFALLYDAEAERLPDHVEVVLNDRVIELQGGLDAELHPGDVLGFLPAHAGG